MLSEGAKLSFIQSKQEAVTHTRSITPPPAGTTAVADTGIQKNASC